MTYKTLCKTMLSLRNVIVDAIPTDSLMVPLVGHVVKHSTRTSKLLQNSEIITKYVDVTTSSDTVMVHLLDIVLKHSTRTKH